MIYSKINKYFWLIRKFRFGRIYLRKLREFELNDKMKEAQMRELQWGLLKKILDHAYRNVPFYHRRFEEAGVHPSNINKPDDFRRLPILTRKDIQTHVDELVATNYDRNELHRNATGGSTGSPMPFYEDNEYLAFKHAAKMRARGWTGFFEGQKTAVIWGAARDLGATNWWTRLGVLLIRRQRRLNANNITAERMEEFARVLIDWKPRFIYGYPSSLYLFACYLKERGLDVIRPTAVETSAEKLLDNQRAMIEDVFRCRVLDFYGSREIAAIACECNEHQGLHIFSDNVYLELLREGKPAEPGLEGEVIITGLTNYAMPLIRYQNGDLARARREKCPCGRPFPLLTEVVGRSNDLLVTPQGQYVHSAFFSHILFGYGKVQQYQVYQKSLQEVDMFIQGKSRLSDEALKEIQHKVTDHLGPEVEVTVKQVEKIPPTRTGKHRYLISEVRPKFLLDQDDRPDKTFCR